MILALVWLFVAKKNFRNIRYYIFCYIFNTHFIFSICYIENIEKQVFIKLKLI